LTQDERAQLYLLLGKLLESARRPAPSVEKDR